MSATINFCQSGLQNTKGLQTKSQNGLFGENTPFVILLILIIIILAYGGCIFGGYGNYGGYGGFAPYGYSPWRIRNYYNRSYPYRAFW